MIAETVLAEVMTEVAIAELPPEEEPGAILAGLLDRGYAFCAATKGGRREYAERIVANWRVNFGDEDEPLILMIETALWWSRS